MPDITDCTAREERVIADLNRALHSRIASMAIADGTWSDRRIEFDLLDFKGHPLPL
ncbi:hypothetical protein QN345_00540 [Cryobacterium sp. 10I1]|uniref:hypothetical protein n=1 Tax=Cryobacterium sp. 10I1 TaxID=3048578 RepID=UPI002B236C0D|nr:hypothetical protein [Cryobacterium sp. 10I1]MEB0303827.1 hypothetical protein [Cryobacterium sp. 10I1]